LRYKLKIARNKNRTARYKLKIKKGNCDFLSHNSVKTAEL